MNATRRFKSAADVFFAVLLVFGFLPKFVCAASDEVRGTWITTTGYTSSTSTIYNAQTTNTNFAALRSIGLNSIYMDMWRNGYTYFRSPTNAAITGSYEDPGTGTRDILADTLLQAHRNQMSVFGWFQYGLMASFGNPSASVSTVSGYMKNNGWLLQDASGSYTNSSTGYTWMNPLVPQVKTYVTNMLLDAVRKYNLQGIQLDDHVGWPIQFGYDSYTKSQYLAETGNAVPTSYNDASFTTWRTQKVTSFMQGIVAALHQAKPSLIISDSPPIYPFSLNNYCEDWPTWEKMGLFNEYVPQVYTTTSSAFKTDWSGSGGVVSQMNGRPGDFAGGIAINGSSGTNSFSSVVQPNINTVRGTTGIKGEVLWYSDGVLQDQSSLTSYYNVAGLGQANRPDVSASSLMAPVEGATGGSNQWQFTVSQGQYYDLIAANGATWRTQQTGIYLTPGTYSFAVSSATQVELLENASIASSGPATGQWSKSTGGAWSADTNWVNLIVPDGSGATATLATPGLSVGSMLLDSNRTLGHLVFNSPQSYMLAAGGGSLTIDNSGTASTGTASIVVTTGSHEIAAPVYLAAGQVTITPAAAAGIKLSGAISGPGGLNVSGSGSVLLANSNSYSGGTSVNSGRLNIANAAALGSGPIDVSGGTLQLGLSPGLAFKTSSSQISVTANGKLDLSSNSLILDYTAADSSAMLQAEIRGRLAAGTYLSSSLPAGQTLAYGDNAILGLINLGGQSLSSQDLIVESTYPGDANLDGKVDIADLGLLASHYAQSGGWTDGDFNYDGVIDISDLGALATNYGVGESTPLQLSFQQALAQVQQQTGTVLPEPTIAGLLLAAASGALTRRFIRARR